MVKMLVTDNGASSYRKYNNVQFLYFPNLQSIWIRIIQKTKHLEKYFNRIHVQMKTWDNCVKILHKNRQF